MGFQLSTFVFEVLNFVVLLWILERVAYRPIAQGLRRRRDEEVRLREGLVERQRDLEAEKSRLEVAREHLSVERTTALAEARATGELQARELVEGAKAAAATERSRQEKLLHDSERRVVQELGRRAIDAGRRVSSEILRKVAGEPLHQQLWEAAFDALSASRPGSGENGGAGPDVVVVGARPFSAEQQGRVKADIERLLGASTCISFEVDGELCVGYRIETGRQVFEASLREHLERVADEARRQLGRSAKQVFDSNPNPGAP